MILGNRTRGEGEHPLTLRGDGVHLSEPVVGIHGRRPAVGRPLAHTHGEDALRRALRVDPGLAHVVVVEHCHVSVVRIEGDAVRPRHPAKVRLRMILPASA